MVDLTSASVVVVPYWTLLVFAMAHTRHAMVFTVDIQDFFGTFAVGLIVRAP